jgi:hypothetical protein
MTYLALRKRIAELCGLSYSEATTDPNDDISTKIGSWVNNRYKLLAGRRSWNWRIKDTIIQLETQITTGTVTATNASTTITFTSGPAVSVANYWIKFSDSEDWYIISAHTAASTTATLTKAYLGTTGSKTYTLRRVYYPLPTDIGKILTVRQTRTDAKLTYLPVRLVDEVVPDRTITGTPLYYTIAGLDSSNQFRIEFYPITDAAMNLSIRYYSLPVAMSATTDVPIFPEEFHDFLVWDVLATYGYIFTDDKRITEAKEERKSIYAEMVLNDVTGEAVPRRRPFDEVSNV